MPCFNEFTFPSNDGRTEIYVRECVPDGEIRGTVQIVHGVVEHSGRYEDFMRFLAENGYAVAANDHLGHGKSVASGDDRGFFCEHDGWNTVVSDIRTLAEIQREKYQDVKRAVFGHSMGSFLARTYIIAHPDDFDAAVICGTGQQRAGLVAAGRMLAEHKCRKNGPRSRSRTVQKLAFAGYNRKFKPVKTGLEWLSRNEENIIAYAQDPMCGGTVSVGLFRDMMCGIQYISDPANIAHMRKDLPVFFIAGALDPVGEAGAGVARAYRAFLKAGMTDVSLKLYKDDRHEILNEPDRETVYNDVLSWLREKM
ncbi:MAG: lysophospholipase [Oscillospiraceae bacterium]|nr:lysophospholipase [Oscillospiraceae bacterium]